MRNFGEIITEPSEHPLWPIAFLIFAISAQVIVFYLPLVLGYVQATIGDSPANGISISLFSLLHWLIPVLIAVSGFDLAQHVIYQYKPRVMV